MFGKLLAGPGKGNKYWLHRAVLQLKALKAQLQAAIRSPKVLFCSRDLDVDASLVGFFVGWLCFFSKFLFLHLSSESVSSGLTPVCHVYFVLVLDNPKPEHRSPGNTTGDDCRGRITYLGMLAKLLHPRRQLFFGTGSHCWLMANFFPTRTPKCSSLELISRRPTSLSWHCFTGWLCHGAGLGFCLCWTSRSFVSPLWWGLLEQQRWPPACWQLPTVWFQPQTCWELWYIIHFISKGDEQ